MFVLIRTCGCIPDGKKCVCVCVCPVDAGRIGERHGYWTHFTGELIL